MKIRALILVIVSLAFATGTMMNSTAVAQTSTVMSAAEAYVPWDATISYESITWKAPKKKDLPKGLKLDKSKAPYVTIIDGLGIPWTARMKKVGARKYKWRAPKKAWFYSEFGQIGVKADGSSICQMYITWLDTDGEEHLNGSSVKIEDWRSIEKIGNVIPPRRNAGEDSWVEFPCGGDPLYEGPARIEYTRTRWPEASAERRGSLTRFFWEPGNGGNPKVLSFQQYRRDNFIRWYLPEEEIAKIPCRDGFPYDEVYVLDVAASFDPNDPDSVSHFRAEGLFVDGTQVPIRFYGQGARAYEYTNLEFSCSGEITPH